MWIFETITELCWHNTEGLLQFLPCSKQDISLQGHLSTTFPLQPCGKDLFPYKSPPGVSTEPWTQEYLQIPSTNNSQPVADSTFLTASH